MVEIKAADLEVRCFFTWRIKGHIRFDGSGGMETGDWTAVGFRLSAFDCRLSAYRCPWDGIPERGPRLPTIRLQTLDSIDFTYHSGVPPFGGWRHHLARWEACHWIRGSRGSPMNPVPLPPQGEMRSMERKNRESYISCTIPQFPPLVVNAVSQSPACVSCHMTIKPIP